MRGCAVFDLDGTLVDTAPDIAHHLNAALAARGWPALALADVREMIGDGATRLVDRALAFGGRPGSDANAVVADFLASYRDAPLIHSEPYPGVAAALADAASAGWALAVCTNKPQEIAEAVLAGLGLRFVATVGGGRLPVRKPHPAPLLAAIHAAGGRPERSVLIGDSVADAGAARAAGAAFVAVPFGYHHGPLDALAPDAWLNRFADLTGVLSDVERRILTRPE